MEKIKLISFFLIVVSSLSGIVLSFVDKYTVTTKAERSVRRINRDSKESTES